MKCKVSGQPIKPFMSFGKMPIANSFLKKNEINSQFFYNMKVGFCQNCFTFQLIDVPNAKQMFNSKYAYLASTSLVMQNHWRKLANLIVKDYKLNTNSFVVEIGSNDGIFLKNISNLKIPHLGVDASSNVSDISKSRGVNSLNAFFNTQTALDIRSSYGKADIIVSTNTMHHIEDINSAAEGMSKLIKNDGTIITEDPSLKEMLVKNSYDQIYAEHMYIWSLSSISSLFNKYDMEVYDIKNNTFHGGCSRYFIAKKNKKKISNNVYFHKKSENRIGINKMSTYEKFKKRTIESKRRLKDFLAKLKDSNKKIVGYGAPAKSTTILNYCDIDGSLIEKIFDNSETKIGKFTPGKSLIPIEHTKYFESYYSEYCILFAWNHEKEILNKEKKYKKKDGKWIIPIPKLKVI